MKINFNILWLKNFSFFQVTQKGKICSQQGVILIVVLWFMAIVTVMVATLASETRLSAKAVLHNKMGLETWNDTLQALQVAQMELLINRMPDPPGQEQEIDLKERKNKRYHFDGRVLQPAYPVPKTVTIRIYDHAGKINLQRLSKRRLRQLLEKRIGDDLEKMDALQDAWQDWIDRDDMKRANGAEKDYYETLSPPYEPRNSRLETVEEFLLIKGFAEVFEGVEMDTAFTVYGNTSGINPNLATREALLLLPGINEEIVNTILTRRREKEFKGFKDFNDFIEPEQLAKFRSWLNFSTSNFYTIAIQTKKPDEVEESDQTETEGEVANNFDEPSNSDSDQSVSETEPTEKKEEEENQRAYMITVQPRGFNQLPKVLIVNPYGVLPDSHHEQLSTTDENENKSSFSTYDGENESESFFDEGNESESFLPDQLF